VLTLRDSTQGLAIDRETRVEEEGTGDGNDSDCAIKYTGARHEDIQKCWDGHSEQELAFLTFPNWLTFNFTVF
jgi:hypothetical protein